MANIVLHPAQSEVYNDLFVLKKNRFSVAVCSRGFGKSYLAATTASTAVAELCALPAHLPNKNVTIIAPTYSQVTDIYFPLLAYEMDMEKYATKSSRDLGRFWFPNNVELKLVSYEAIERQRGSGSYLTICDEVRDWTKGVGFKAAWQDIIQPTIVTRWSEKRTRQMQLTCPKGTIINPGRALIISTPKGYDYLYDMYNYQEVDPLWKSYHYDYRDSPYLDQDEIERLKHTLDPIGFNNEYLATFEDSGNRLFYCFNRKIHVRNDLTPFGDEEDVHIGIDFNVNYICRFTLNLVNSGNNSTSQS